MHMYIYIYVYLYIHIYIYIYVAAHQYFALCIISAACDAQHTAHYICSCASKNKRSNCSKCMPSLKLWVLCTSTSHMEYFACNYVLTSETYFIILHSYNYQDITLTYAYGRSRASNTVLLTYCIVL